MTAARSASGTRLPGRRYGPPWNGPARSRLGFSLASEVAACTTPPPPPGTPGWAYLAAILAERNRRAVRRLIQARAATATVWPELAREVHGPVRPMPLPVFVPGAV